jgi:predicted ester cyclase
LTEVVHDGDVDFREAARALLKQVVEADDANLGSATAAAFSPDCTLHVSAPVGELCGHVAIIEGLFDPLRSALSKVRRRDTIFIGSQDFEGGGGQWTASLVQYVGNFESTLWGVAPSRSLAFLRAGEFFRWENGRIAEGRIIFDVPDLMHQGGLRPYRVTLGNQSIFPAPATQDGILPSNGNGEDSAAVMKRMLRDLISFDPETKDSAGMTGKDGAWHDDMLWYGPAGIGATYRWDGFVKDHRAPFLDAFPNRNKGETICSLGDGNYAAICGFGMPMVHSGDYLGLEATGRSVHLPVMDFYRIEDGKLIENWVFLDYVDMFTQLGVDLIAQGQAQAENT